MSLNQVWPQFHNPIKLDQGISHIALLKISSSPRGKEVEIVGIDRSSLLTELK